MQIITPNDAPAEKQMELVCLVGKDDKLSTFIEKCLAAGYVPLIHFVDPPPPEPIPPVNPDNDDMR